MPKTTKQPGVKPKRRTTQAAKATPPPFVLPFLLGADPEFLAFYGHRNVHANELFETFLKRAKFPSTEMGYTIGKAGVMGWDGHSSTGEMRPSAANTPEGLTKNIGEMIKEVNRVMPFIDFSALSIGSPVGGHIHVDADDEILNSEAKKSRILKLVATFLMPIFASEHRICSAYRSSGSYGSPEDMRYQRLPNGKTTLEIRGPSAEWTVSPHIARATLSYIAAVWQEIRKRDQALAKTEVALKTKPQINAAYAAILSDYRPVKDGLLKAVAETVRGFEFYAQYKDDIEFILNPEAVYAEKEKAGWNLMTGWGLTKETNPKKKDLMSEKKVSAGAKGVNMQLLDTSFSVSYNNDYNVGLFSEALTERIAGLGWKLKKEYFLFGLKKGVEGYLVNDPGTKKFYSIPSNVDRPTIVALTDKMRQKYGSTARTEMVRIDPKSGKTRVGFNDVVLIGLPYDLRQQKNIKSFIHLIWSLEKGKMEAKAIDQFPDAAPEAPEVEEMNSLERILKGPVVAIDPKGPSRFGGSIEESLGSREASINAGTYAHIVAGEANAPDPAPVPTAAPGVQVPLVVFTAEEVQRIVITFLLTPEQIGDLPTTTRFWLQRKAHDMDYLQGIYLEICEYQEINDLRYEEARNEIFDQRAAYEIETSQL